MTSSTTTHATGLVAAAILLFGSWLGPVPHASAQEGESVVGPLVFHSPDDDGTSPGCPPLNADVTRPACALTGFDRPNRLNLYAIPGPDATEGPCHDVCGVHAVLEIEGGTFLEFVAEPGVTHNPACDFSGEEEGGCPMPPDTDKIEIVASFASEPAPETAPAVRIGTVFVDPGAPTGDPSQGVAVSLNGIQLIDGSLQVKQLPRERIAVPEPGIPLLLMSGVLGLGALDRHRRAREARARNRR